MMRKTSHVNGNYYFYDRPLGAALISFGAWMVFRLQALLLQACFALLASYFAARAAAPANDLPGVTDVHSSVLPGQVASGRE
jgi:hypothetical protein